MLVLEVSNSYSRSSISKERSVMLIVAELALPN